MAAGWEDRDTGKDLDLSIRGRLHAEIADQSQLGLIVARNQTGVHAQGNLPLRPLGYEPGPGKCQRPICPQHAAGVIVVEMADRDGIHGVRREPGSLERRNDPRPLIPAHLAALVADPVAYPRFDQDAPGRRLDQQAVERLQQPPIGVYLPGN